MALNDKLVEILLKQFNFSQTDLDKVKAVLDNISVKTVDGKTYIEIRVNKVTVVLEGDQNES
jgi:hypothetical protein